MPVPPPAPVADGLDGEELAKGVTRERFQELSLANKWIEIDKILSSKEKK